jgi:CRP-like cAMP-binding protein
MFVKLKYLNGTHPGSTKEFSQPVIKIGRAPSCDFTLYDSTGLHSVASRSHSELRCEGSELFVYDLNSSNGTFVNDRRVMKSGLKNGDVITFGPEGLQLQINFLISSGDETEFLAFCPLFQDLAWDDLQQIMRNGDINHYSPGDYLFRIGEVCNTLYVIYSGLIEISAVRDASGRPSVVGFVSSGESLGESLALIGGKHRSEAQVVEAAEILTLHAGRLKELIRSSSEFALKFTIALCNRLSTSESQLQARHTARKLQGDLSHFDLATIIQTLNNLQDTGVLSLYPKISDEEDSSESIGTMPPFARLYFESGEVRYIKFGSRSSDEAFYQLFQMPLTGIFSFGMESLPEDMASTEPIRLPIMNLLLEAHRLQDEAENFKIELPDMATTFRARAEKFDWVDDSTRRYATQIWTLVENNASLCEILGKVDCSNFTTYKILLDLIRSRQIEPDRSITGLPNLRETTIARTQK